MAKQCNVCLEVKEDTEFHKVGSKTDMLRPDCNVCRNEFNKQKYYVKALKQKEQLAKLGCCVCGISRHEVLEVHHLHATYKRYGRSQSLTANLQDINSDKAVVLCANDHNLFHSHFGGKNAPFPPQTKQSVVDICLLERAKGGL